MTQILQDLALVAGRENLFVGEEVDIRYRTDPHGRLVARPICLVRPKTAAEVAAILKLAQASGVAVTTQGGRTGTVLGALPDDGSIVLSLERMSAIEDLDAVSMTVTVEAGATLQSVQEAAEAAGLFLPLDLGARGSATVGGVVSTNAGGLRAVRWGLARDMVLGLEAVLANGTIVSGLKKTLKDNAGYDWKHLMIGSEGTLGVVTRATLRLRPMPRSTNTALIATDNFEKVYRLLRDLDLDLGGQLTSFEVMWRDFYRMITEANRAKRAPPLSGDHAFYVLVEAMGGDMVDDAVRFEAALSKALERGQAQDVVVAQSARERGELWAVREDLAEAMGRLRPLFAFDVSVALRDMPPMADQVNSAVLGAYPDATIFTYGHAGDGNLHFVIGVGDGGEDAKHRVDLAVYQAVARWGGSISAEHGIGLSKRDYIQFSRSPGELALMRTLKDALDPSNTLNPGKVIDMGRADLQ